ncbi:hypothetical protein EDB89DRAFT_2070594 [Lactarius sanguifluus]|nr:hypothetical protein EDB89DRAFT_2070594 [Lactarius sanguifluus]
MARIRDHFSQSLDSVKDLRIEVTRTSSGQDSTNGERWTEFLRSFRGAEKLHVAGELATDILHALRPVAGEPTSDALPALTNLYIIGPRSGALQDAVRSIITPRKLSGSPIRTTNQRGNCRQGQGHATIVTSVSKNGKISFGTQRTVRLQKSAKNGADFAAARGHNAFLLPEDDYPATDPLMSGPPVRSPQTALLPLSIESLCGSATASPLTLPSRCIPYS